MKFVFSVNEKEWKKLYDSSFISFFQTIECFNFFKSLSFLEAFAFGIEDKGDLKGVIVGYILKDGGKVKQFLSRRAIITGGPLLAEDISDEALEMLLRYTRKAIGKKSIYIESRNFNDYSKYKNVFERCGFEYIQHLNFQIDTSSKDIVNTNLGKSRKRDIKTSLREGAIVVENPSIEQIKDYYSILKDLYMNKVKTPLFPFEFFEKLYQLPQAVFLLVEYNNEIIGGTVCVSLEGKVLYEWFACGKDGANKNIFPSTLATYSGIEYAANNKYPIFDMMGAGKPDDGGYGVRDFKAKFGGKLVGYGRFLCISKPVLYKIGKLGVAIMKKF